MNCTPVFNVKAGVFCFQVMDNQHGGERENIAQQYSVDESKLIDFSVNLNPLGPPKALESGHPARF